MSTQLFDLTGKRALVTGSTGGIGLGIAVGLARAGALVAINGRDGARTADRVAELAAEGLNVRACAFDVTDSAQIDAAIDAFEAREGGLDILVNNAGGNVRGPLASYSDADWGAQVAVNFGSAFMVSRRAVRTMIERRAGKIIHVSSAGSIAVRAGSGAYSATKAGVNMLTKSMAVEWGPHNIQVNCIGPSFNRTKLMEDSIAKNPELEQFVINRTPLGRWSDPMKDLGGTAIFLASAASDFVTGQLIFVDGGFLSTF